MIIGKLFSRYIGLFELANLVIKFFIFQANIVYLLITVVFFKRLQFDYDNFGFS